jgi:tryptophan synthase alpha subunit
VTVGNCVEQFRSHPKKGFSPGIGVESLSQILDILEYACGLILGLALISNEIPNFEIVSRLYNKIK